MSLALHSLKPSPGSSRGKKRLGRGNASGHGTTATRGTKGQRARQGGRKGLVQFGVKHFVSRLPKARGFKSFKAKSQVVILRALENLADGTVVTPELMRQRGLIMNAEKPVKIIGQSKSLPKNLVVKVQAISAGARVVITKAQGLVELLPLANKKSRK